MEAQPGVVNAQGYLDAKKAKRAVNSAAVVFATCVGAGSGALAGRRFGMVIVDEATQVRGVWLGAAAAPSCCSSQLVVLAGGRGVLLVKCGSAASEAAIVHGANLHPVLACLEM